MRSNICKNGGQLGNVRNSEAVSAKAKVSVGFVSGAALKAHCRLSVAEKELDERKRVFTGASFVENPASEEERMSDRGTRAETVRRELFETGEDGGVFSGLATTTFCLEEV